MAAGNTRRNRPRRPASGPVDGNLARKLDRHEQKRGSNRIGPSDAERAEIQRRRREQEAALRRARQYAKARAAIRAAQKLPPAVMISFAAAAALTVAILLCYIRLNSISRSIVEMKDEISQLETEQVSLLTRYEQAFDLTSVKEIVEAAGMTQPSDSQIYYIDLPGEDQAVAYIDNDVSPLTRFAAAARRKFYEVMEYFQ